MRGAIHNRGASHDCDLFDWVKALGQWHLADPSASETRCGAPMLGNNHARWIPDRDRRKCPKCWGTGPERI